MPPSAFNMIKSLSPEFKNYLQIGVLIILVLILISLLIYLGVQQVKSNDITPFVSNYNGEVYEVRKNQSDSNKATAANYLAKLSDKVTELVDYMYRNALPDKIISQRLYYRWNRCELKETGSGEKSIAYTLNKSVEIRICIRKSNGEFEDQNRSMFVLLHELGHVMSITYDHNTEFSNNFSYIVNLASNLGLYKPEDFNSNPQSYCGGNITTTPCDSNTCSYNVLSFE